MLKRTNWLRSRKMSPIFPKLKTRESLVGNQEAPGAGVPAAQALVLFRRIQAVQAAALAPGDTE